MGWPLSTLTPADIQRFQQDGYVVIREAFPPADGREMEARWWAELEERHGIVRDDRATWRQPLGDLKTAKHDAIAARILSDRVRGVLDDLLGPETWSPPADWGRCIVTFPEPGDWDVPTKLWHWDTVPALHLKTPLALFVVSFIGSVAARSGGTLVLSGSHRLLMRAPADPGGGWERFHRLHPWLMALTGNAPSPSDRVEAFMTRETVVDGVPLRVVELTGEPGDMVFCHPALVHCVAPNGGDQPRMMRIRQQLLSHRGRALLGAPPHRGLDTIRSET